MAGKTPEETDALVAKAVDERDVDKLLELFEPDAVFVEPMSGTELRGHQQIREAVTGMIESGDRLVETAPPKVLVNGEIALVLAAWTIEGSGPDGEPFRHSGTATDVMRRQPDGTWRYVIDNPAGIDILGRGD